MLALLNIYLVEDSPVIREGLIATLQELAPVHVVGTAEDEQAALRGLAALGEAQVDLVIADLFLKSGSGLGLLRALQKLPRRFRLVVLSNFATTDTRQACLALGADQVFDKSTEIDALLTYCHRLADSDDSDDGASAPGVGGQSGDSGATG
jgi:DNA-binding NarL/FixJ family response regulator